MNTKEMAEAHNAEVAYCYAEISKALELMRLVNDDSGRLNEATDILENISLGTFIGVNKND